jgi:C-terminal processing protease CtpA/Prc
LEGIYVVDDDTLKICVNPATDGVKERPGEFSTKDKPGHRLLVFKRDKDRKPDSIEGLAGFVGVQIKVDDDSKQVMVVDTNKGSPAEKAGLKKDDVLLKIGDQDATDLKSVVNTIRKVKPGSELSLRINRDGKEKDLTVKATVVPFFPLDS